MKVFENGTTWASKVNFADEHNVLVGYDTEQGCCEDAGYVFVPELPIGDVDIPNLAGHEFRHDQYVFDRDFCQTIQSSSLDAGEAVAFRLTSGSDTVYLILYNAHNGYYSHGFTFEVDGETKNEGHL